jgi:REP element-mobilizing transposase RayT
MTKGEFVPFKGGAAVTRRGYLPHWTKESATYFVTFRLRDSLPSFVAKRIISEKGNKSHVAIERYLDECHGECLLRDPAHARVVANAIEHFHGVRYELYAYCVMPNHVHIILQPYANYSLSQIMHSIKSFTSSEVNRMSGRSGSLWQVESFDHLVRTAKQLYVLVRYVASNAERAGLSEWPWQWPTFGELDRA